MLKNKTTLTLDLSALAHNYKRLKAQLEAKTKFMAVVKAGAYGSDAIAIAKKLEELGVDYIAVAFAFEGEELRNAGIQTPILVLHPQFGQMQALFDLKLEPTLYSYKGMEELKAIDSSKQLPIHLKINTGLNRLGFKQGELASVLEFLKSHSGYKLKSVYSHLIASEDLNAKALCQAQIEEFKRVLEQIESPGITVPLRHMTNTSGILNFKEAHFDMVRSGIGLYGFSNGSSKVNLKPIGRLSTVISKINELEVGEGVGYNSGFIAQQPTRVATIPIGHADGISRIYSQGKAVVWIGNQPAAVLGNVCMDMMMVDITHIDCREGDEVILFDQEHTASEFAEGGGTISYELLTAIGARVSRHIQP